MLLSSSAVLQYVSDNFEQTSSSKAQFDKEVIRIKKSFYQFHWSDFAEKIYENNYTLDEFEELNEKGFSLFIYKKDSLVFWNNNDVDFSLQDDNSLKYERGVSFDKLKNGYYLIIHDQKISKQLGNLDVVALYLLKSDYGENTNKYLINKRNKNLNISDNINFTTKSRLDTWKIQGASSSIYAYVDSVKDWNFSRILLTILISICIFIMLLVIYSYSVDLVRKKYPFQGFAVLVFGYTSFRILMYLLNIPPYLRTLQLFEIQSNDLLFGSLGDLFISLVFFLILVVFFVNYVPLKFKYPNNKGKREWFFAGILTVVLLLVWFGCFLIDNVVQNSIASFKIVDLNELPTLVSISSIFIYLFGALMIIKRLVLVANSLLLNWEDRLKIALLVIIAYMMLHFYFDVTVITIIVILMVLLFAVSVRVFYSHERKHQRITYIIFWVFFSAAFVSFQVNISAEQKEIRQRLKLADKLILQENYTAEKLLKEISQKVMDDNIIKTFIKMPFLPESEMSKYINTKYFNKFFYKFDIEIFVFDKYGKRFSGRPGYDLNHFNNLINKYRVNRTEKENLIYTISNPKGLPYYIMKLKIFDERIIDDDNADIGNVILKVVDNDDDENVYPELVIDDKDREPEYQSDYSYAIYKEDTIETVFGEYFYPDVRNFEYKCSSSQSYKLFKKDGYSHIIYNADKKENTKLKSIVISKPAKNVLEKVALFSYLFIALTFIVLLILFLRAYLFYPEEKKSLKRMFFSTLKKRINSLLIIIVFVSLLTIGLITIIYFQSVSTENQKDRLIEIEKTVLSSVENEFANLGTLDEEKDKMERILKQQSIIHNVDISIFDLNGKLIGSSLPVLFDNGIVSKSMNALAYNRLTKDFQNQVLQKENIGALEYTATYSTVKNASGEPIAYMNVPYFGRDKNLQSDISNFLVVLINVYILIMLLAILMGVLLSNSVTRSLDLIGEKLRQIRLGGKNEKLDWPDNDEIGALVREYNSAIEELDQSVKLLAQAEREYAWQEMAKQVAHEIKNPLTPMKLSIQHLQRAQRENHPRLGDLTTKVTKTLIEQIEHLTKIANEFSSFAQMPKTQEEYIELNEMLNNMLGLYEENNDSLNVVKSFPDEDSFVYTDRTQLNRVFLNIVKNAIEAMNERDKGVLIVSVKQLVDTVIVSFSDNGSGIPEERRSKVFVPSFTSKRSGMGLGLAISKNIIENAGGKIWFETEEGKGTTFFIQLPLRR